MDLISTDRLILRHMEAGDAAFILELLNDADFLRFIGDKGVRDLQGALGYIQTACHEAFERHGVGMMMVERTDTGAHAGICGLLNRDYLDNPDIGFAFAKDHRGVGLASEAVGATLTYGFDSLGYAVLTAITDPHNTASRRLLERADMEFVGMMSVPHAETEVCYYELTKGVPANER